ncbi:MAG: glycosyltransferase [Cyanobacteriota bacterium]|nr:glycosyltransferase [Cyanobacteriota bacterium]
MLALVSICIATYKRPEGLKRLILALNQLTFSTATPPDIEIVIVDNDAAGSARALCEEIRSQIRWQLKYDVEPEPGVTYARNRTIANASENTNFIAIIDDDEVPDSQWLDQLLKVQREYNVDVVTGPIYPCFEDKNTPEWIKKGQFFEPNSYETGHLLNAAFTGNVLVRAECLKGINPVFDHRFAFKGSEDTHLFMRLVNSGYKIVWSKQAVVQEWIPASRTKLNWLIKRSFWGWSSYSLFEKEIFSGTKRQIIRALKGSGLIGLGLLGLPFSLFQGKWAVAKSIINISRGLGTFAGLMGFQGQW